MGMDEPRLSPNSNVRLIRCDPHQHEVARPNARRSHAPEVAGKKAPYLDLVIAPHSIIPADRLSGQIVRRDRNADAIQPFGAAALQAEPRADERSRALGIIDVQ